jgi:hypothetical protein
MSSAVTAIYPYLHPQVYVLDENKQVVLVMNAKPMDVEKNSQNITK